MFEFNKPETKEFNQIAPGQYEGTIAKVEIGKTQAGHRILKLRLKLEGAPGFHFVDLNMEHPSAKQISLNNISSILYGALLTPPSSLKTLEDIAAYVTGLPVNVKLVLGKPDKNGNPRLNTYFNDCSEKLVNRDAPSVAVTTAW